MIEHRTEPVNIGGTCKLRSVASSLFGRHVTRRAQRFHHRAGNGAFSFNKPCQAKISEMWLAFSIYQDVSGLNISMQNPSPVRIMNGVRQLDNEFRCTSIWHWLTLDCFIESPAFHKL